MHKILVVDDEAFARTSIEESIKAADQNIQVFTAANGEEALPIILKEDLDVILTDIKMPGMSGMELLAEIRKIGLNIEVIILSSYNEFNLARQAIQLGAFDYLFKPVMLPEDIMAVVQNAFLRQKDRIAKIKTGDRVNGYSLMKEKEQFFSELINSTKIDPGKYHELIAKFHLPEDIDRIVVTVYKLKLYQKSLVEIYQNDIDLLRATVYNVLNEVLGSSLCHQLLCNSFYEYIMISWEQKAGNDKEFLEDNEKIIQQVNSLIGKQCELEFMIGISSIGKTITDISKLYLEATFNVNEVIGNIPVNQEMRIAIDFINNKLSDKNLSLQMVADHIGLSRNYFSKVFKETMGVNFIDYITRLRVEKARSLYINTDMKIYEIAELVGYSDWHYLYSVYKKLFGHSMSQEMTKRNRFN